MRVLSRAVFREIAGAALLGTLLFAFVLFLQKLGTGKYFEILLRGSASPQTALTLFLLVIPPVLSFAIPIGTLVGVLIGLGRMSSDGEITAMRAAGIAGRRVAPPILAFSALAMAAAACASLWLTPWSIRETYRLINSVIARQLTAEVRPRVFEEQFTNTNSILYVGDVASLPGTVARWRNVFIADLTAPEQRSTSIRDAGDAPAVTIAAEAVAAPDPTTHSIRLSMTGVWSHQTGKDPAIYHNTFSPKSEQSLRARPPEEATAKAWVSMDTLPLAAEAAESLEARIELHQRLALPVACVLLAIAGIPLGVSTRKGGKSVAFALTVSLAFFYYMMWFGLLRMAQQGRLEAWVAVWTPNAVYALAGTWWMARLERPGDRDWISPIGSLAGRLWAAVLHRPAIASTPAPRPGGRRRSPFLPGVIDSYVLRGFLFWAAALLAGFVLLAHAFIFFELLGDIMSRDIPLRKVLTYHFFLTPKLIYDLAPMSVLVAVLATFGILAKNNEVTAMKACGVSLFRLGVPLIAASAALSGALFAFDHYYIPEANRIQDGILDEIKGRPVQTYLRPDRKWISGLGPRIYYYRYFDAAQKVMAGVHIYELSMEPFRLKRHISAERARWEPSLRTWVLQNGWTRDIEGIRTANSTAFVATTFPELTEPPSYFLKEVKQEKQLNFLDLDRYIGELQQSGFDTVRLRVQYHKKFSVPVFALIMALLAVPFSFTAGRRGAMAGFGAALGIAMAYLAAGKMFEELGNLAELPPAVAAWSPDTLFSLAGLYLFTRMRT